jgi:cell division protein FtsB
MTDSLIIEVLLGVLALMIGVGSFVGASRAAKIQAVGLKASVEANAYQRATDIYEGAIKSMESQITRLRQEISALDGEINKLRASNVKLSGEVTDLQEANLRLLAELRARGVLQSHGKGRLTLNLNDTLVSYIRTYVPVAVGLVVGWLVARGLVVDPSLQAGLTTLISGGAIAVYYAGIRSLEARYPAFGWLLGAAKTPIYGTEDKAGSVPPHAPTAPMDAQAP